MPTRPMVSITIMTRPILLTLLLFSPLAWANKFTDVPLLEFLPNGTALTNVKIPGYDKNRQPTSLLVAEEVKIIDKDKGVMEVTNGKVHIYKEEQENLEIAFQKAHFYYQKNYLETKEPIMIQNQSIAINGEGACYDLETKQILIIGPTQAVVANKSLASLIRASLISTLALLPGHSAPLPSPTESEILKLEQAPVESHAKVESESAEYTKAQTANEQKSNQVNKRVSAFLTKTGKESILVSTKGNAEENNKSEGVLQVPNGALVVSCDGAMYYDAVEGHLVCLQNVDVKHPDFTLTCADQLKVFLEVGEKKDKKDGELNFGATEAKEMLAQGEVELTYNNAGQQKPITATGDNAHYEIASGEMLIKGGPPTLQQGRSFIEALEEKVWFKISKKGFTTGQGRKRTVYLDEDE